MFYPADSPFSRGDQDFPSYSRALGANPGRCTHGAPTARTSFQIYKTLALRTQVQNRPLDRTAMAWTHESFPQGAIDQ
jgi:hypothetical protein